MNKIVFEDPKKDKKARLLIGRKVSFTCSTCGKQNEIEINFLIAISLVLGKGVQCQHCRSQNYTYSIYIITIITISTIVLTACALLA